MLFLSCHRDRRGFEVLRRQLLEQHLSSMDRFSSTMVARGPTFTTDGTLTGSVHILDLPDLGAACAFVFDEPCYQARAYRDVLLRRWRSAGKRTMWNFRSEQPGRDRYLVVGFTSQPIEEADEPPRGDDLIASGLLMSDDDSMVLGVAVLLEAIDAGAACDVLADGDVGIEVHQWRFGGRST